MRPLAGKRSSQALVENVQPGFDPLAVHAEVAFPISTPHPHPQARGSSPALDSTQNTRVDFQADRVTAGIAPRMPDLSQAMQDFENLIERLAIPT